jgi:hypothetical protein
MGEQPGQKPFIRPLGTFSVLREREEFLVLIECISRGREMEDHCIPASRRPGAGRDPVTLDG